MSSNVGLSTPRGSGTSGYVQRNLSLLKPRSAGAGQPYSLDQRTPISAPRPRKPDQDILNHDRLREVEVKVLELRDDLEEAGDLDEDEIDRKCEELRVKLINDFGRKKGGAGNGGGGKEGGKGKGIKGYQIHELAEAKAVESEKLRRALGLRREEIGVQKRDGGGDGNDQNGKGNTGNSLSSAPKLALMEDDEHPMARQERRKKERDAERVRKELERDEEERRNRERERNVRDHSSSANDSDDDGVGDRYDRERRYR